MILVIHNLVTTIWSKVGLEGCVVLKICLSFWRIPVYNFGSGFLFVAEGLNYLQSFSKRGFTKYF